MIHVSVGTEIYGRVKQVGSTPVVTKFWALSLMPIVPLQSYYFIRFGQRKSQGCPFLAESYSTAIVGIPLVRLDRLSVVISYVARPSASSRSWVSSVR